MTWCLTYISRRLCSAANTLHNIDDADLPFGSDLELQEIEKDIRAAQNRLNNFISKVRSDE